MLLKKFKYIVWIPAAIILVGAIMILVNGGLNKGFAFSGGTEMTININAPCDDAVIRDVLRSAKVNAAPVRYQTPRSDKDIIQISIQQTSESARQAVLAGIQKTYPQAALGEEIFIGAMDGVPRLLNAILTFAIAGIVVFLYMAVRFGFPAGGAALLAMSHDVLFGTAILSIFRLQLTNLYLIAMLFVAGCSAMQSFLMFEKIFEIGNRRPAGKAAKNAKERPLSEIIGEAAGTSVIRALVISGAVVIVLACIGIFAGNPVVSFTLPAMFGVAISAFTALHITGPVWGKWAKNHKFAKTLKKA